MVLLFACMVGEMKPIEDAAAVSLRRRGSLVVLLQLTLVLSARWVSAGKVTAVIVFGDSTVDAGNNNQIPTIAKSNFPPYGRDFFGGRPTGRFCNGRLATDFISEAFGLKSTVPAYLDPTLGIEDFATGVTFASAASGFDNVTANLLSVIPLWKQLEYFEEYQRRLRLYQGVEKATTTIEEALYVISMGTNDFLENYYAIPTRSSQFAVEEYQEFITGLASDFLRRIYALGARKVDLTGAPPMGCIPVSRTRNAVAGGHGCREDYNQVGTDLNRRLRAVAMQLNAELPGMKISFGDVFSLLLDMVNNPNSYGFENGENGCCASGLFETGVACNRESPFTCKDANKYVFWDSVHPSEMTYRIIADNLMRTSLAQFL